MPFADLGIGWRFVAYIARNSDYKSGRLAGYNFEAHTARLGLAVSPDNIRRSWSRAGCNFVSSPAQYKAADMMEFLPPGPDIAELRIEVTDIVGFAVGARRIGRVAYPNFEKRALEPDLEPDMKKAAKRVVGLAVVPKLSVSCSQTANLTLSGPQKQ